MQIAKKIKKYIKASGLQFQHVAQEIGISPIYLNTLLCNRRDMTKTVLRSLHGYLNDHFLTQKQKQLNWQQEVEQLLTEIDRELKK